MISSEHLYLPEATIILDGIGSSGNSAIHLPTLVNSPSLFNARNAKEVPAPSIKPQQGKDPYNKIVASHEYQAFLKSEPLARLVLGIIIQTMIIVICSVADNNTSSNLLNPFFFYPLINSGNNVGNERKEKKNKQTNK